MGHLFHDCDRTFRPGLRQTETNECAKRIPDRAATTSNCTPPPLPILFSSSGFFASSLSPRLVLFFVTSRTPCCRYFYPRLFTPLSADIYDYLSGLATGFYVPISRVILLQPSGSFRHYTEFTARSDRPKAFRSITLRIGFRIKISWYQLAVYLNFLCD